MHPFPRPSRPTAPATRRTLTACALGASGIALAVGLAPAASAAPGDNGDIKVHESTTAVSSQLDEPKVCSFYLDAFNFDVLQLVSYTIEQEPPTGTSQVASGSILLTTGAGHTGTLSLPNGHYKVDWTFVGEEGSAKHKSFMVECPNTSPSPSTSPVGAPGGGGPGSSGSPSAGSSAGAPGGNGPGAGAGAGGGPIGSVGTGGGGSVHGPNAAEITAGSVVLAGAAALGLRAVRRRSNRNAAS